MQSLHNVIPRPTYRTKLTFIKLIIGLFAVLSQTAPEVQAATMESKSTKITFSDKSGQVMSIASNVNSLKVLSLNEDRYDLEGQLSVEAADEVVAKRRDKTGTLIFECVNKPLGLKIEKRYRLQDGVLAKEVRYARTGAGKLLRVSSRSMIDDSVFKNGYYYTPTEDGYGVATVPFIAGTEITQPVTRLVHTSDFIYYLPKSNRIFSHYRYKINGDYFYAVEADRAIESQFVPGGGIVALGESFIGDQEALTLESHYVLMDGDPRDYHKFLVSQPPYVQNRGHHVPSWFPKARMFFPENGTGQFLIEEREKIGKDVRNMLGLLKDDEYLMVFFNHWSTSGDYPYQGTHRYGTSKGWSQPVSIEKLKESIRWLKSISPRVKVGGYFFFTVSEGTTPLKNHENDWFIYNKSGRLESGGDGMAWSAVPDFSSGYRAYLLDQLKHALTDTGFDWLHLDTAPTEDVNWKTRKVVQSSEHAKLYFELSKFAQTHDKALVQNYARNIGLWSHGSYVETQQADRWELKDWRIMAVAGYLGGLYRRDRPGVWQNMVYGTQETYGLRNAFGGMRGWMRGANVWWRWLPQGLAYERVIDELLENPVRDVPIRPSWWKMETDKLEAEAFGRNKQLVIPVILHDDKPGAHTISLQPAQAGFQPGQMMFGMDFKLMPSTQHDAFTVMPWQTPYLELTDFQARPIPAGQYSHQMQLEPRLNYYHLLSAVPAWVYKVAGQQTSLLLPENRGVRIEGSLKNGATSYALTVSNKHKTADILAYVPSSWKHVQVRVNGKTAKASEVNLHGQRCLLITVPQGNSKLTVAQSSAVAKVTSKPIAYQNPSMNAWKEAAARLFYDGLSHRAFTEAGKSALALRAEAPATSGTAGFPMYVPVEASGFSLKVKGTASGGRIVVHQHAGDQWEYSIQDDFTGWKEFNIQREQMQSNGAEKKWGATIFVTLVVHPAAGQEMTVADFKLLPAREGDIVKEAELAKKKVAIYKTEKAPAINGVPDDSSWGQAAIATDFQKLGGGPSASKTNVKLCYDEQNLYVLFENLESIDSLGLPLERDAQIWNANHVELFIGPPGEEVSHLLVDPAGTIQDFRWTSFGRDAKWNGDYEVKTSLNWKAAWTAEFKIPFKTLGKAPQAGETWAINFARKDLSGDWSNWGTPGEWLDPEGFGEVVFAGERQQGN